MPAMIDASCEKCGRRFGWCGTMANRPACPRCGHRPDQAALDAAEAKIDAYWKWLATHPRNADAELRHKQRIDAGLTLRKAATLLEISGKDLSDIENGREEPTADLAEKMAQIYECGSE